MYHGQVERFILIASLLALVPIFWVECGNTVTCSGASISEWFGDGQESPHFSTSREHNLSEKRTWMRTNTVGVSQHQKKSLLWISYWTMHPNADSASEVLNTPKPLRRSQKALGCVCWSKPASESWLQTLSSVSPHWKIPKNSLVLEMNKWAPELGQHRQITGGNCDRAMAISVVLVC